eukprot:TRINITY_DN2387_c0_g1_i2.p1 TRINITY_DN2387_c0_g1~~TRINITY_DN2387_c0_g1_i2.p1  ORF type:complete len:210 (+),score=26.15 TRINITY_DN2387_c0_g1_i2:387-1016(+)
MQALNLPPRFGHDIQINPSDVNEFLICVGDQIQRHSRFGDAPSPSSYALTPLSPDLDSTPSHDIPICIEFCPVLPKYFLAGYSTGTISLYDIFSSEPLMSWHQACVSSVVRLQWSSFRLSSFFVLDSQANIYFFDLLKSDQRALATANLTLDSSYPVTQFSLSPNVGGIRLALLAFSSLPGTLDLHLLPPSLTTSNETDKQSLRQFLER